MTATIASGLKQRLSNTQSSLAAMTMQGMSDLASPILYIMRDEAEAFWCFTALMRRLEGNFQQDSM